MLFRTTCTPRSHPRPTRHQRWHAWPGWLLGALLLLPLALAACDSNTPGPGVNGTPLNQLHWCTSKPTLVFQDALESPPKPVADWTQVKQQLGFTTYLPATLPKGTCLVSGEALINARIQGNNFGASYLLPGGVSLAFSETAVFNQQTASFQCSQSSGVLTTGTPTPGTGTGATLLCLGAKGQTNVVIDSDESQKDLQALFNSLQPNVDWIPKK